MNKARRMRWANLTKEQKSGQERRLMVERICPICGTSFRPKTGAANQRMCCYDCMPDGKQLSRGEFLAKIKIKRGGKCIRCG